MGILPPSQQSPAGVNMNMQAQYTKGPWHWQRCRTMQHLQDADGNCFAQISMPCPHLYRETETREAYEANARLIAAAPDQNASLTELLAEDVLFAWVNETGIGKAEYQRRSAIVERARAALAKATQA